jgi:hypothetical protein
MGDNYFPPLRFWAFLGEGLEKAAKFYIKNSMSKIFNASFFSFFWLCAFGVGGISRQGEFTNTIKKVFAEAYVDFCRKKSQIQCRIFLGFVYRAFGRFSARGVRKHRPVTFLASDPPDTHAPTAGVSIFWFWAAPCQAPAPCPATLRTPLGGGGCRRHFRTGPAHTTPPARTAMA